MPCLHGSGAYAWECGPGDHPRPRLQLDDYFAEIEDQARTAKARQAEAFHYVAAMSYGADIEEYHRQLRRHFNGTANAWGGAAAELTTAGGKSRGGSG